MSTLWIGTFGSVDTGLQYWTITTIFQFLECHNLAWITERNPIFDYI